MWATSSGTPSWGVIGNAALCRCGYFHFLPYTVPILMDTEGKALPREGVQKGRLVLVDPIPTSYCGGFTFGRDAVGDGPSCHLSSG